MKKLLVAFIFIFSVIGLIACTPSDNTDDGNKPEVDTVAPMLMGVTDQRINVGDAFDPRVGVTARDDVDGVITDRIQILGSVDVHTPNTYQLTYIVKDSAGNEARQVRTITVVAKEDGSDLFINNGDFSKPLEGTWSHWSGEGGKSTASIVNGEAVIDIQTNGTYWYSTQFSQNNLTITQGKMYRIEFEARADVARGIVIKLEDASYFGYIDELVNLTPTMTKFTYEFFVIKPTITNGKLNFGMGSMTSRGIDAGALTKVYLDNIVVTEIEAGIDEVAPVIHGATDKTIAVNDAFDPFEGITVSDNRDIDISVDDIEITGNLDITTPGEYTLVYKLKDASGNETTLERVITVVQGLVPSTLVIVNGDFEEEQLTALPQPASTGWGWHGAGNFTALIKDGVAKIEVRNLGGVVHGVQFYQQLREVTQGQIYKITFRAKADLTRPMMFALEEGTTRRFDQIVFLTNDWVTYEIIYQHNLTSFTNGKFAFFMGDVGETSVPTTIYLDDITVETVETLEDKTAPLLFGVGNYIIAKGSQFNPLQGVTILDNVDKLLTLEDITVTGTVDSAAVGTYTLTYEIEDSAKNKSVFTRVVEVVEPESMLPNTFLIVNGDFETEQLTPTPQPATTGWGWHGAGTFTAVIKDGIATIDVTNVGTVPHGVQFYLQNRVIATGATYKLTFKAKADIARSFRLSLEAGTDVRFFQIVGLTTEWATYEVFISPSGGGFTNGKLGFFMGLVEPDSVPTTFYFDDISMELVGYKKDVDKPMIIGLNDVEVEKGTDFDPKKDVLVFDILDKTLNLDSLDISGTVDANTVGTYTLTYKLVDQQDNETVMTRVVTVIEPVELV